MKSFVEYYININIIYMMYILHNNRHYLQIRSEYLYLIYIYSTTLNLVELLSINMSEYQNSRIRLVNRSNYKTGFEFAHFYTNYIRF